MKNISTKILYGVAAVSVAMLILVGLFVVDSQLKSHERDLEIYRNFLAQEGESQGLAFKQLTSVSHVLTKNPIIINALGNHVKGQQPTTIAALMVDKNLEAISSIQHVSAVFLMDPDGLCLYSSQKDFVGKNYGFRPYFQDGVNKGAGLYAAMGVTSKQPGIYYAQAVASGGQLLGVAVIKINPAFFNLRHFSAGFTTTPLSSSQIRVAFSTENGILFNTENNLLSSLQPLSGELRDELTASRQFPPDQIESLGFPPGSLPTLLEEGFLKQKNSAGVEYFLFGQPLFRKNLSRDFPQNFFLVHIVDAEWFRENYHPATASNKVHILMLAAMMLVLILLLFLLNRRHQDALSAVELIKKETRQRLLDKEKYEKIINQSPEGFWFRDLDTGKILEVNQSFCRMLGLPAEQIVGRHGDEFLSAKGLQAAEAVFREIEGESAFESQLQFKEGQTIDVFIHASQFITPDSQKEYCFAFFADITARKKEQERLALFSRAVEQSPSSIVITDNKGDIVYVNPYFCEVTGYSRQEVYGQNPRLLQSGKMATIIYEELWQTISRGDTWKGILENKKKDGGLLWEEVSISPMHDKLNNINHFIAIKYDITQRVHLEKELAARIAELELIVEHAAIGISYIVDHRFIWVSQAGAEMFGYGERKNLQGLASAVIFQDKKSFGEIFERAAAACVEGRVFQTEQLMKKKDGTLFWCALTGKAIDSREFSQGAIWLSRDISRQKEVEQHLQLARDRAEQANLAKSHFLANMSHEIRTPMNAIIGMSDMALDTRLDKEQNYLLKTIHHSAESLLGLINGILDFSKIESGQLELDHSSFALERTLTHVLQTVEHLAREKGLQLDYEIAPDVPQVLSGDESRLRQILLNLVTNGVKFSASGGVSITVTMGEEAEETMLLHFHVKDSGVGVVPEKIDSIFDEFVQVDNSMSRDFAGTGLGLSICRKLCQLMGGTIWVNSVPEQGSTFSFSVLLQKVSDQESDKLKDKEGRAEWSLPALRILIVDDNEANRFLARAMFRKGGHQVIEAVNGLEALKMLLEHDVDVVLMDVQMPKIDGFVATRIVRACEEGGKIVFAEKLPDGLSGALRSRLAGHHMPIVALTAHAMKHDKEQCLEAGMDGYSIKPIQKKDIFCAIRLAVSADGVVMANLEEQRMAAGGKSPQAPDAKKKSDLLVHVARHLQTTYDLEEEQVKEMIRLSATSLVEAFEHAEQALAAGDIAALAAAAHKAKGVLLGIGLSREAEEASVIEMAARAREGKDVDYGQLVHDLQEGIEQLLQERAVQDNKKDSLG